MVGKEIAKTAVVGMLKTYVRDAGAAYATAFLGGFVAGAGYIGLKNGIEYGKTVYCGATQLVKKAFKKKDRKAENPQPESNTENPETTQE